MAFVTLHRGPLVESRHRVHVAVCDSHGELLAFAGDPGLVTYMRSAAKPFQALAIVREGVPEGYGMTAEELSICCGSHSGQPQHLEVVRRILARTGVPESALACGPQPSLADDVADEMVRRGEDPKPIHNNCSGKHAGMLALAQWRGWGLDGYQEAGHPVQERMRREVAEWTGVESGQLASGGDGCGVVTFGVPLWSMARGYAALARAAMAGDVAPRMVVEAMTRHPFMVAGTGRLCTRLMQACSGSIFVKVGAEGVYCAGDPARGVGVAVKVEDGSRRASEVALLRVLHLLGIPPDGVGEAFREDLRPTIRDTRGKAVGYLEGEFELRAGSGVN